MSPSVMRARLSALKQRLRSRFVLFGTLRETYPVNPAFGIGKGTPVDRCRIELRARELDAQHPDYQLIVAIDATKAG